MFGSLTDQQIEHLLTQEMVGRIACYDNGTLYIVPTSYAYSGDCIYAHSHEGTKLNMMRHNPEVCFEVDNITDMANWKSVIAWGRFDELSGSEKEQALGLL